METLQAFVFCLSDKSGSRQKWRFLWSKFKHLALLLLYRSSCELPQAYRAQLKIWCLNIQCVLPYIFFVSLLYISVSHSIYQKLHYFLWLIKVCEKIEFWICSYKCKWKYRTPHPLFTIETRTQICCWTLPDSPTPIPQCTRDRGESITWHQVRLVLTSVVYLMFKWPALSWSKAERYQEHQHVDSDQL